MFKTECQKWIKHFELSHWIIVYEWKDLGGNVAQMGRDLKPCHATIGFNTHIENDFDREMSFREYIKYCAKHEICHLLIGKVALCGYDKDYTSEDIAHAEEELVNKLLNLL